MTKDISFAEACRQAQDLINRGHKVFQKFTCAGCGQRLTMDTPNIFYELGTCDKCNKVTNISQRGCGYMLDANIQADPDIIAEIIRRGFKRPAEG